MTTSGWRDFFGLRPADASVVGPFQLDEKFRPHFEDALRQVNAEPEFRQTVRAAYQALKAQGPSITRDKAAVMRALAGQFRRDQMGHVYAAIVRYGD